MLFDVLAEPRDARSPLASEAFAGGKEVSVPEAGLPLGLQLAARPFQEKQLLRVAYAYERSHRWLDRRPFPG